MAIALTNSYCLDDPCDDISKTIHAWITPKVEKLKKAAKGK